MIKFIEIFLMKLNFALNLAKYDSLFFIQNIRDFSNTMFFARLVEEKNKHSNSDNFIKFWEDSDISLSYKLVKEIAARADLIDYQTQNKLIRLDYSDVKSDDKIIYETRIYKCYYEESKFHERQIVKELKDNSKLIKKFNSFIKSKDFKRSDYYNHIKLFKTILDNSFDMRFEASILEEVDEIYSSVFPFLGFKIDWMLTSKDKMYVYDNNSTNTNDLSYNAQKNLVEIILYGLFEHKKFINNLYNNVWVNKTDSISFFNIDYIYKIEDIELLYVLDMSKAFLDKNVEKIVELNKNMYLMASDINWENNLRKIIEDSFYDKPRSISHMMANIYNYIGNVNHGISLILLKLQYLLSLLEILCPDIDVVKLMSEKNIGEVKENENYSFDLNMLYYAKGIFQKKDVTKSNLSHKRSSFNKNEFKSCKYRKSSIIVWLPIIVLIYLLILFSN
jgi:hypothetical protein